MFSWFSGLRIPSFKDETSPPWLWESGNPAPSAGFPSAVGNSVFGVARLFHGLLCLAAMPQTPPEYSSPDCYAASLGCIPLSTPRSSAQILKPALVQALVPQLPMKTLHVRILHRACPARCAPALSSAPHTTPQNNA